MLRLDVRDTLDVLVAGDLYVVTLLARLLLGQPDAGELRVGEDRRGQDGVVGGRTAGAEHVIDRDPGLVLRNRRELGDCVHVSRSPDPR